MVKKRIQMFYKTLSIVLSAVLLTGTIGTTAHAEITEEVVGEVIEEESEEEPEAEPKEDPEEDPADPQADGDDENNNENDDVTPPADDTTPSDPVTTPPVDGIDAPKEVVEEPVADEEDTTAYDAVVALFEALPETVQEDTEFKLEEAFAALEELSEEDQMKFEDEYGDLILKALGLSDAITGAGEVRTYTVGPQSGEVDASIDYEETTATGDVYFKNYTADNDDCNEYVTTDGVTKRNFLSTVEGQAVKLITTADLALYDISYHTSSGVIYINRTTKETVCKVTLDSTGLIGAGIVWNGDSVAPGDGTNFTIMYYGQFISPLNVVATNGVVNCSDGPEGRIDCRITNITANTTITVKGLVVNFNDSGLTNATASIVASSANSATVTITPETGKAFETAPSVSTTSGSVGTVTKSGNNYTCEITNITAAPTITVTGTAVEKTFYNVSFVQTGLTGAGVTALPTSVVSGESTIITIAPESGKVFETAPSVSATNGNVGTVTKSGDHYTCTITNITAATTITVTGEAKTVTTPSPAPTPSEDSGSSSSHSSSSHKSSSSSSSNSSASAANNGTGNSAGSTNSSKPFDWSGASAEISNSLASTGSASVDMAGTNKVVDAGIISSLATPTSTLNVALGDNLSVTFSGATDNSGYTGTDFKSIRQTQTIGGKTFDLIAFHNSAPIGTTVVFGVKVDAALAGKPVYVYQFNADGQIIILELIVDAFGNVNIPITSKAPMVLQY